MNHPVIELKNVKKSYTMGTVREEILKGMSFRVDKGEFIAIVGASGSGKSTLLHIMGLLDRPTHGHVLVNGIDVSKFHDNDLAGIRGKRIGFVFQFFNLYPTLDAKGNVELPMSIQGRSGSDRRKRSRQLLKLVGLSDRMDFMPNQLSGGQRQRVSIARALAMNPDIILADEPTGNLDSKTGKEIIKMLVKLSKDKDRTIVMITHDKNIAKHANRIIQIKDGEVILDRKNNKRLRL